MHVFWLSADIYFFKFRFLNIFQKYHQGVNSLEPGQVKQVRLIGLQNVWKDEMRSTKVVTSRQRIKSSAYLIVKDRVV